MSIPPNPTLLSARRTNGGMAALAARLPSGEHHWFGMGRQAIVAALHALGATSGSVVLVPAYQCPASLDPFIAFGATPVFYDVTSTLEPDLEQVEQLLARWKPHVVMVIHYYGFPCASLGEIVVLARRHGAAVLEDCAHAMFSTHATTPLGTVGDASIFSLAKTLAVPRGGLLVLRHPIGDTIPWRVLPAAAEAPALVKLLAYEMESWSPIGLRTVLRSMSFVDRRVRTTMEAPGDGFDLCAPRHLGAWTHRLVETCDPDDVIARRRRNYHAIADVIRGVPEVTALFAALPDGVCPLAFPVVVSRGVRDALLLRSWRRGSPVRAMWDRLPASIDEGRYPVAADVRRRIVTLPTHQGVTAQQASMVAERMVADARTLAA